jgi:hypothetical protein
VGIRGNHCPDDYTRNNPTRVAILIPPFGGSTDLRASV